MLLLLTILSLGTVSAASFLHPAPAASSGKYFDHVVTILMENNDLPSVLSQGSFQASIATQYTLSTGYSAVTHPSQPNYVALFGGSANGVGDNGICCYVVNAPDIVDRLETAGLTWRAFAEDASGSGTCSFSPPRGGDHFPFLVYADMNTAARCANFISTSSSSDSELVSYLNTDGAANYVWLTPNDDDNSHDTPIATGDAYLAALVPHILSSTTFTTTRSALFIVYDEGNDMSCASGGSDCIYASWSGPTTKQGFTSSNSYNHYSYVHTILDNWGLPTIANDAGAPVMAEFFTGSGQSPLSTGFTASPPTGQVGQTITFTAGPSGGTSPYTDTWNFGDGSSGSGPTVTHVYSTTGTFPVTLTTQDSSSPASSVTSTKLVAINPAPLPGSLSISISSNPTSPSAGQNVAFSADVAGGTPPYGVGWDFGDGGISVGLSTTHTFADSGTFNVTAAVTDSGSPAHTALKSVFVTVSSSTTPPGLTASFTFSPSGPSVGNSVTFTSSASGGVAPYTYAWDFGDSTGTDTVANPSYSYSSSGSFAVTLTVTDSSGASISASHSLSVTTASPPPPPTSNRSSGQYCNALSRGPAGDLQPMVSVEYVNPVNSQNFATAALFDTGATYSLAPSSLATSLGLNIADGASVTLTGVGGTAIQAHVFHLTMSFGGTMQIVNVPVAFTDSANQFLIGRLGFLDQVNVTFDSSGQTMCFNAGSDSSSSTCGQDEGSDCRETGDCDGDHDEDDVGCSDDSGDDETGEEDFLGVVSSFIVGSSGTVSGLSMVLTLVPLVGLAGAAFVGLIRAPRRIMSRKS